MIIPLPMREIVESAELSPAAEDVLFGLSLPSGARRLPPRLFYDAAGSALFEQITELPEYYLTRTERAIFEEHGEDMMRAAGSGLTLIELGAGTAAKTAVLIAALLRRQLRATYYPVDVSASALEIAERNLTAKFPALRVRPLVGDFTQGLERLKHTPGRKLVLYIGSSVGNFEPEEAGALLRTLREALNPGDALLLGTDLAKSPARLIEAYNDSAGVTARFNLNMLARINRELGGDFDLTEFRHEAVWNAKASRIEMWLISRSDQIVRVRELSMAVPFNKGEGVHTENSYKFTPSMIAGMLAAGGFRREQTWTDIRGWFGVHLARVSG